MELPLQCVGQQHVGLRRGGLELGDVDPLGSASPGRLERGPDRRVPDGVRSSAVVSAARDRSSMGRRQPPTDPQRELVDALGRAHVASVPWQPRSSARHGERARDVAHGRAQRRRRAGHDGSQQQQVRQRLHLERGAFARGARRRRGEAAAGPLGADRRTLQGALVVLQDARAAAGAPSPLRRSCGRAAACRAR